MAAINALTRGNGVSAASHDTGVITPGANRLVFAWILTRNTAASVPTLTGCGLTWVSMGSSNYSDTTVVTLFRAMGPSPTSGAVHIAHSSGSNACEWELFEIDGVDTTGADGAGAVVQAVPAATYGGTSVSATLAAFGDPNNITIGVLAANDAATLTPGTGFTAVQPQISVGSVGAIHTEYQLANDTTVDGTSSTSLNLYIKGVEVKVAAAGGGVTQAQLDGATMRGVMRGVSRGMARRIVTTNWKRHGSGLFVPAFTGLIAQPVR